LVGLDEQAVRRGGKLIPEELGQCDERAAAAGDRPELVRSIRPLHSG